MQRERLPIISMTKIDACHSDLVAPPWYHIQHLARKRGQARAHVQLPTNRIALRAALMYNNQHLASERGQARAHRQTLSDRTPPVLANNKHWRLAALEADAFPQPLRF